MRRSLLVLGPLAICGSLLFACSSTKKSGFEDPNAVGSSGTSGGPLLGGDEAGTGKPCAPGPGNWDIPGNNCDDDGDGTVDNPPTCDDSLSESGDAEDFARALGICAKADTDGYGLISAKFTSGTGSASPMGEQHGILPKFGNVLKPREGSKLGVLSTGYAQEYNGGPNRRFGNSDLSGSPGEMTSQDWMSDGDLPSGFPKKAVGCEQAEDVHDVIGVELKLKAPKNASGVRFDLNFFSSEWPAYICSMFNDGFIAYLDAKGFNNGTADNMSFDSKKNPISVNNGFFDRCTPNVDTGCAPGAQPATSQCPGGAKELAGTGYAQEGKWCEAFTIIGAGGNDVSSAGGATGWLTSSAPVAAGEEFTLTFYIWDTGDGVLDSSVLLDNFKWAEGEITVITDRPR